MVHPTLSASKRQETSAAAKRVYYFRNFVKMESQFRISFLDFFYFFLHDNTALYVVVLQYWAEEKIQHCFEQVSGKLKVLWHFDDDAKCIYFGQNQSRTTEAVSRNLLKTMSDFFFCQLQLHINMYYQAKKIRKKSTTKF